MEAISLSDASAPSSRAFGRRRTGRPHRPRPLMVAAGIVVVIGAASLALSNQRSDHHQDLSTVATVAPTQAAGTSTREDIRVTPELIQLGDGLVGIEQSIAKEGGHTYVLAARAGDEPLGKTDISVLSAFDEDGVERWRSELDGAPSGLVVLDGDLWVSGGAGTVSRVDASDGRVLGEIRLGAIGGLVAAFGSVWVTTGATPPGPGRLVRIDPDLSTTSIELSSCSEGSTTCPNAPVAGAGLIWVPLQDDGLAMIDPRTSGVTIIPVDDIGHEVQQVAVHDEVAYAASGYRVTSIVDGRPRATIAPGEIWYLGPMSGVFGLLVPSGRFQVLGADDPMVIEDRRISLNRLTGPVFESDGEVWMQTGRTSDLRRIELMGVSDGDR